MVGRKPAKAWHRKRTGPKRSSAAITASEFNSPVSELQEQLMSKVMKLLVEF